MTFDKPEDISYTEMCIYIDENIYEDEFDADLIYQYLYHIVLMLARKHQLFGKHCYYDGFALFGATRIYFRLTNKKQFQHNDDGTPKMQKIKSVLNYAKNILYPLKVDYEQSEYCQSIVTTSNDKDIVYNYDNIVKQYLDGLHLVEFDMTMQDVCKTCKVFLSTIPYKRDSVEWLNIYTSVMLTFLNSVTLRNKSKKRIEHLQSTTRLKDSHITSFFEDERDSAPILFHLDSSMSDYITVLTRQLRRIVAKDLSSILHTAVTSDIQLSELSSNEFISEQEANNEY